MPLVYDELRQLAAEKMAAEKPGQTLEATALVHEAYLRLVGNGAGPHFNGRGQFFATAAQGMRKTLVDSARRNRRTKDGGGRHRVELDDEVPEPPSALGRTARTRRGPDPASGRRHGSRRDRGVSLLHWPLGRGGGSSGPPSSPS